MRAGLLVIILAVGCGGSPKPQPTPPNTNPVNTGSAAKPAQPVVATNDSHSACKRMMELKATSCGAFAQLPFDEPQCVAELDKAANDPTIKAFVGCVVQPSCEEVKNCLAAASQQANTEPSPELRTCTGENNGLAAVGYPPADYAKRNGAGVTLFSKAKSTKDLPIEMCGIPEENRWLESLACDDGSHPVANAETVRVGNVGPGGRCGSIVDKYRVSCGAKSFDIFIDAYVCPTK